MGMSGNKDGEDDVIRGIEYYRVLMGIEDGVSYVYDLQFVIFTLSRSQRVSLAHVLYSSELGQLGPVWTRNFWGPGRNGPDNPRLPQMIWSG